MKSLVINRVNNKNNFVTLPCGSAEAASFAGAFMDGEYAVYEIDSVVGSSDVVATAPDVANVMFKNKASGKKGYASLMVDATTTDEQIFSVLMGLTLNGVLIDEAYVLGRRTATRF